MSKRSEKLEEVELADYLEEKRKKTKISDFESVRAFHEKFGLPIGDALPDLVSDEVRDFRLKFLQEEMDELREAYAKQSLPDIADALVDLVYIALGTALFHGLPWPALFAEVQRANMTKVRASRAEDSKRGSAFDVTKPEGWQPPDIVQVLMDHGWKGYKLPFDKEVER